MPRKAESADYQNLILSTVRNKFPYLILGIGIILLLYVMIAGFPGNKTSPEKQQAKKNEAIKKQESVKQEPKKYIVQAGDTLWQIAEANYGSGFNAYDLATKNNIPNPNLIEKGQIVILPSLTPQQPTIGEIAPVISEQVTYTGNQYTVQPGDFLWQIAQNAYGDGYGWTKI